MLGTGRFPGEFVAALLTWFRVTNEEDGPLLLELRTGKGLYYYLGILTAVVESTPGMECRDLLMVDRGG